MYWGTPKQVLSAPCICQALHVYCMAQAPPVSRPPKLLSIEVQQKSYFMSNPAKIIFYE